MNGAIRLRLALAVCLAALLGCPADEAIDKGTMCDDVKCPVGTRPSQSKSATGSCDVSGGGNATTRSGQAAGMCFGSGECKVFCEAPAPCCGGERWGEKSYECDLPCAAGQKPPRDDDEAGRAGSASSGRAGGMAAAGSSGAGDDPDAGMASKPDEPQAGSGGARSEPGGTQATALDLGALTPAGVVLESQFVGGSTPDDWYQFQLEENAVLTAAVQEIKSGSLQLQLFRWAQIVPENMPYHAVNANAGAQATMTVRMERGTYYFRVYALGGSPIYDLSASSERYPHLEPRSEPGNSPDDAQDLGALTTELTQIGGYVGGTDAKDFYRFTLLGNAELSWAATDVEGRVQAHLYAYAKPLDEKVTLGQLDTYPTGSATEPSRPRAAGDYFVRVIPVGADAPSSSLYLLSLNLRE